MAPPAQPLGGVSFGAKFASTRLFDIIVGVAKLARLTMAHPASFEGAMVAWIADYVQHIPCVVRGVCQISTIESLSRVYLPTAEPIMIVCVSGNLRTVHAIFFIYHCFFIEYACKRKTIY